MSHIRISLVVLLLFPCTCFGFDRTTTRTVEKPSENLRNKNIHCDKWKVIEYYDIDYYRHTWLTDGYICEIRNYALSSDREYYIDKSEQIKNLTIRESTMETLPEKMFVHLTSLKILSVSNTTLKHVNPIRMGNLTTLELSSNQIKSFDENAFSGSGSLKKIDLSNNKIEEIDFNVFGRISHLQLLDLSYNSLKVLQPPSSMLSTSISLNLSSNALTSLSLDELKLFTCEELNAEHNKISEISIGQATSTLKILNLNENTLGNNFSDICKCSNLRSLSLNSNNIDNIGTCFALMKSLQSLELERNNIYQINQESFHADNQIDYLDLSFNHLEELDEYTMSVFSKLSYLYLDGNRIFTFYENPKLFMPLLVQIGLSHNKFKCSKLFLLLKRFEVLKVKLFVDKSLPVNTTNINGLSCYNNHVGELLESNDTDAFLENTKEKLSFTLHKVDLLEDKINGILSEVNKNVIDYKKNEDVMESIKQNSKSADQKISQLENLVKNLTEFALSEHEKVNFAQDLKNHAFPSEYSAQSNSNNFLLYVITFLFIAIVLLNLFIIFKKFNRLCFYQRRRLDNETPLTNVSSIDA